MELFQKWGSLLGPESRVMGKFLDQWHMNPSLKSLLKTLGVRRSWFDPARFTRALVGNEVTPDVVVGAYRLLLERDPENPEVVEDKTRRCNDVTRLVEEILCSEEFRGKHFVPGNFTGLEPPMSIDGPCDDRQVALLFEHIQNTWQTWGTTEPHWSVLSAEQYKKNNIAGSEAAFYASGEHACEFFLKALARNNIDLTRLNSCLELGCGLGRVSIWLAKHFDKVHACDISLAHLNGAREYVEKRGPRNVEFLHLASPNSFSGLPRVDGIFSIIVLQHNPPPLMEFMLGHLFAALNAGGVAYIQIPTYRRDYAFSVERYLRDRSQGNDLEMHALPQSRVFDIAQRAGMSVVEVWEDTSTGEARSRSNVFLLQKR